MLFPLKSSDKYFAARAVVASHVTVLSPFSNW